MEPSDASNLPQKAAPTKFERALPDSFAEWLAEPSQTIEMAAESEQELLWAVIGQAQVESPAHRAGPRAG